MFSRLLCSCLLSVGLVAQQASTPPDVSGNFRISGVVVDSTTGQPLPQTRVGIATVTERDVFTTVVTADDGQFSFAGLMPGKYTLTAQRRGYLTRSYNEHEGFATSIVAGPGMSSEGLVFRLTPEAAISGTVRDEHGDAVRRAQVYLFWSGVGEGVRTTLQQAVTTTDDEGFYRFPHLRAGRYFVAVVAEPWYAQRPRTENTPRLTDSERALMMEHPELARVFFQRSDAQGSVKETPSPLDVAYPLTFYPGVQEALSASPIALSQGQQASADVGLRPVGAVHFRITLETTEPDQNMSMVLGQKVFDAGIPLQVNTHAMTVGPGVLEIVGVPPGRYVGQIYSFSGGQMQTLQEREINLLPSGELDTPASTARVSVKATIVFEPPAVAGQAVVQLREKKWRRVLNERITAKNDVEFKGLHAGSYEISLQNAGDAYIKNITAIGAKLTGRTLDIKESAAVSLTLTAAQGGAALDGVASREGKSVAGVMVLLVPADPANNQVLFRRDQTDSDGSFHLANVVPGRYTLLAIDEGWELEWANPAVLKKFMPQGEPLVVETKGKYSLKLKVQEPAPLRLH